MKKVITYGSFDLFHDGHYRLLKRAKALGDYLIVGVTTEQYDNYRGKMNVVDSLMQRIENVKQTGLADEIIVEDHMGQKIEDIQKYEIDIFTVGSDWKGCFEYLRSYCEVVYLERTKNISSTELKNKRYSIIQLGVIGTGRIANRFPEEIKYISGINLVGAYNPNLSSAETYSRKHELAFYTDNINEFLDKVDAVYIASPHETHYEYIKKSLQAGKHVLCEKPITLKRQQTEEVYAMAEANQLILMEGIKTAYCPGFIKVINTCKSGVIGKVTDVEAAFTKLVYDDVREIKLNQYGGSITELASYPLLAIFKILGVEYEEVSFVSYCEHEGVDKYSKVFLTYKDAMATAKVGLGVKSEGSMLISGTNGYIKVDAPWWKTESFEVCYEDGTKNEKFYTKYLGEGLRYEVCEFVNLINGLSKKNYKLSSAESIAIVKVIDKYLNGEKLKRFPMY